MFKKIFAFTIGIISLTSAQASVINLITNGNFETGSTSGWTTANTTSQGFNVIANGANVPYSGQATQVNAAGQKFVAVSDQTGQSGHVLEQTFTKATNVQSLILQFDWFDNTHSAFSGTKIDGSQQVGRVDILTANASPWDVSTGVVQNLLLNAGTYTNYGTSIPWVHSTFDLSNLAAGTYTLRFANGQSTYYQEFGVDNVQLMATVPEPSSIALLGLGFLGFAAMRRKTLKK